MTSNQSPQPLPKYCILCVDDDHSGLVARAALLEDEGYFVTAVSCPLMALEYDVSKILTCPVLTDFSSYCIYALHTHLSRSCCSAV
jgi:hypothetical protein